MASSRRGRKTKEGVARLRPGPRLPRSLTPTPCRSVERNWRDKCFWFDSNTTPPDSTSVSMAKNNETRTNSGAFSRKTLPPQGGPKDGPITPSPWIGNDDERPSERKSCAPIRGPIVNAAKRKWRSWRLGLRVMKPSIVWLWRPIFCERGLEDHRFRFSPANVWRRRVRLRWFRSCWSRAGSDRRLKSASCLGGYASLCCFHAT